MLGTLTTLFNLLLVLTGFGLVIVIHEFGHFIAARWAGVRVLAFAVGFGPALFSWRKGLGFRRGSSEDEYRRLVAADAGAEAAAEDARPAHHAISPTEYRLNVIPFGGYVKMLGQDDANPGARSEAPDSYSSAPVAKRMVIISAGVVMNLILAATLFIVVFLAGLRTEPPQIGDVLPGSPAASAVPTNAAELGVTDPGIQPGDTVLSINGVAPDSFNDIVLAGAMAAPGRPLQVEVERPGVPRPLRFSITPRPDRLTRMLQIGVGPAASNQLPDAPDDQTRIAFRRAAESLGLGSQVEPGMRLTAVNGAPTTSADSITLAARRSGGSPVRLTFEGEGRRAVVDLQPFPDFQSTEFLKDGVIAAVPHLLGIPAPMRVEDTAEPGARAGLQPGDIFARIGDAEWPTVTAGMTAIRAHAGGTVPVVVARPDAASGEPTLVDLGQVPVSRAGTIGFLVAVDPAHAPAVVATWPSLPVSPDSEGPAPSRTAAAPLRLVPGSRITAVNDEPVATFADLRAALRRATLAAAGTTSPAEVALTLRLPLPAAGAEPPTERPTWTLAPDAVSTLHNLGWSAPVAGLLFPRAEILLKASNPAKAIGMGLKETRRVMLSTYLTLARLVQGTVKVEHLRGPVGIAHVGTILADRGFIWLLFFLALVSVNLAVINFLPLPIADGGHMVYLAYEGATGRPVSPAVQNAAALAGLVLIVGLFLIVTFNDVTRLFGF